MSGRSERRGWYFYDWANSAFNTSVTTVFLGPYLSEIAAAAADAAGFVFPLGLRVRSGSFFPYVVSLSVLIQVVFLPLVGTVADRSSHKRRLLGHFAAVGSLATMALYFVVDERYLLGGALFVVANVAFGCSIVVYNSFLPQVTHGTDPDTVSARGWALGYAGAFSRCGTTTTSSSRPPSRRRLVLSAGSSKRRIPGCNSFVRAWSCRSR